MQEPIEPADDDFLSDLLLLRPMPPGTSKIDLWYAAGFNAAQKRARRWHAAAAAALAGFALFTMLRPSPAPTTRFVDRVVYLQPPAEPQPPLPSFAAVIENRKQLQDALEGRWCVVANHGQTSAQPPIRAWMADPNLEKVGGL